MKIIGVDIPSADAIEDWAIDKIGRAGPWLAPLPTAFITGSSVIKHFGWPMYVGFAAGLSIEILGLSSTSLAIRMWTYNNEKCKDSPKAPFVIATSIVIVYFVSVFALTFALDTMPSIARFSPLIFPIISMAGSSTIALGKDHRRRLIYNERRSKKIERASIAYLKMSSTKNERSENGSNEHRTNIERTRTRRDSEADKARLRVAIAENQELTIRQAAKLINSSNETASRYMQQIKQEQ